MPEMWIGFSDENDCYQDNNRGKSKRHELDPLWIRIEIECIKFVRSHL